MQEVATVFLTLIAMCFVATCYGVYASIRSGDEKLVAVFGQLVLIEIAAFCVGIFISQL